MCNKGDKVLLENAWKAKFNQNTYLYLHMFVADRNNGTVGHCKSIVTDTFSICIITLFKAKMFFHYGVVWDQIKTSHKKIACDVQRM